VPVLQGVVGREGDDRGFCQNETSTLFRAGFLIKLWTSARKPQRTRAQGASESDAWLQGDTCGRGRPGLAALV